MTTFPPWAKSEDTDKISNIACHSRERQFSTPLTWGSICFLIEKNTQGPAPEGNLFYPQLTDFWLAQFWDNALEITEKFAEWKKARGLMTTLPLLCKAKIKRGLMSALFELEMGELWKQITWFLQLEQRHKILLLLSNRCLYFLSLLRLEKFSSLFPLHHPPCFLPICRTETWSGVLALPWCYLAHRQKFSVRPSPVLLGYEERNTI